MGLSTVKEKTMRRLLFGGLGAYLLIAPAQMSYNLLWPAPQARSMFVIVCLTLYGGAAIGTLAQVLRCARTGLKMSRAGVSVAVFTGALLAAVAAFALASVRAGGPGNIGPVFVVLAGFYSAILSAGAALLWTAIAQPRSQAHT
jgi:hypothetical protein